MKRNNFIILALLSIPAGNLFGMIKGVTGSNGSKFDILTPFDENLYTYAQERIANDKATVKSKFFGGLFSSGTVTAEEKKANDIKLNERKGKIIQSILQEHKNEIEKTMTDFFIKYPYLIKDYKEVIQELFTTAISEKRIANQNEEHRRYVEESPRVKAAAEQRRLADAAEKKRADEETARLEAAAAEQRRLRDADAAEHRRAAKEAARLEFSAAEQRKVDEEAAQRRADQEAAQRRFADAAAEQRRVAEEKARLQAAAQEQARVEAEQRQKILLHRKRG
jgi:hypothetical protein